jgi:excisionase family DNA binding protein
MQAAAKLGIGRTTIGRWIKSGKLRPVEKQSGVWLFSKKNVNLLAAQAMEE